MCIASLHVALHHTMCIMIAPSHNHQLTNAFLILIKGVDIQYHLDHILDNFIAITHLCWSSQNGYTLEVTLNFPRVIL
jgi:hypothetical protein